MGMTKCNTICLGKKCRRRKRKACECGKYRQYSVSLEDACIKTYANSGKYKSLKEFECDNAEAFYSYNGISVCGFKYEDTAQGKVDLMEKEQMEQAANANFEQIKPLIAIIGVVLVAAAAALLFGKN